MDISGIGQYGGLYSPYRVNEIPTVDIETVKEQEKQKNDALSNPTFDNVQTATQSSDKEDNRSRIANLEDISLTFNKNEDFGYLGQDSSLQSLDMQQAISDMQKDSILQEYQYFVGNSNSFLKNFESEDGIVIPKL